VLKIVKILRLLIFMQSTLLVLPSDLWANDWIKLKTTTFSSNIHTVSLDRYGLFYTSDETGNIFKYDSLGNLLFTYSPQKKADVTLLEAWRNVNIFVFYRSFQEFILLDRFLSPSPTSRLERAHIGFARLATYSYDNNLWIIDESDFSLKKYNLAQGGIELNTPLDLLLDYKIYDMNYIKEYQNLVYINDKNSGILVFDNMGNYKNKIPIKGLSILGFYNDEIYYQEGDFIKFVNVYTYAERSEKLPESGDFKFILYTSSRLYLFSPTSVSVYKR